MADQDRIIIFDTTLRDGEQCPGASMNLQEKLQVAEALDAMGVDVIEAGFAVASKGDFESVNEIAKRAKNATICSLSRAVKGDIEAAAEAIKPAARKRIHTFISTSPLHMKFKLQMEPEKVVEKITESVSLARQFTDDVEWSCEDGSRTEHDFLCRTIETAIKAGATTINVPDTVGYCTPEEYAALIAMIKNRVPNVDKAILSVHCHNDLGLAVANSLAAVKAGARQIECTINGIGERAGNAALEEAVMAIRTRNDLLPFTTGIKTEHIARVSRLVSTVTGFAVQNNKAIVGANAFAHESGIHQDGMLKNAQTYEIMTPESVGISKTNLVMGKHSGRHAFRQKLADMGVELEEAELNAAFERFKALADKKKEIYDEDLLSLVDAQLLGQNDRVEFVALDVSCGTGGQSATLSLKVDGKKITETQSGNGPVDAIFKAIHAIVPHEAKLQLYQVHAVTRGTDAQGEVTVRLDQEGTVFNGHGADVDTMIASAQAYIRALNKLLTYGAKQGNASSATQKELQSARI